jgi:hypothetical protein
VRSAKSINAQRVAARFLIQKSDVAIILIEHARIGSSKLKLSITTDLGATVGAGGKCCVVQSVEEAEAVLGEIVKVEKSARQTNAGVTARLSVDDALRLILDCAGRLWRLQLRPIDISAKLQATTRYVEETIAWMGRSGYLHSYNRTYQELRLSTGSAPEYWSWLTARLEQRLWEHVAANPKYERLEIGPNFYIWT